MFHVSWVRGWGHTLKIRKAAVNVVNSVISTNIDPTKIIAFIVMITHPTQIHAKYTETQNMNRKNITLNDL